MELPATTLIQSLCFFAFCAAAVWMAGARLAYLADALADRYQLAKSRMGHSVLSLATSLPEAATTLKAAVQQSRDLALNNLFGGIALQTAILAMSDFWARGAITNHPRKTNHALEATLLVLLLSVTLIITDLGETVTFKAGGAGSVLIAFICVEAILLPRRYADILGWMRVDLPDPDPDPDPLPLPAPFGLATSGNESLLLQAFAACGAILVFGFLLVVFAERRPLAIPLLPQPSRFTRMSVEWHLICWCGCR